MFSTHLTLIPRKKTGFFAEGGGVGKPQKKMVGPLSVVGFGVGH